VVGEDVGLGVLALRRVELEGDPVEDDLAPGERPRDRRLVGGVGRPEADPVDVPDAVPAALARRAAHVDTQAVPAMRVDVQERRPEGGAHADDRAAGEDRVEQRGDVDAAEPRPEGGRIGDGVPRAEADDDVDERMGRDPPASRGRDDPEKLVRLAARGVRRRRQEARTREQQQAGSAPHQARKPTGSTG